MAWEATAVTCLPCVPCDTFLWGEAGNCCHPYICWVSLHCPSRLGATELDTPSPGSRCPWVGGGDRSEQ